MSSNHPTSYSADSGIVKGFNEIAKPGRFRRTVGINECNHIAFCGSESLIASSGGSSSRLFEHLHIKGPMVTCKVVKERKGAISRAIIHQEGLQRPGI